MYGIAGVSVTSSGSLCAHSNTAFARFARSRVILAIRLAFSKKNYFKISSEKNIFREKKHPTKGYSHPPPGRY